MVCVEVNVFWGELGSAINLKNCASLGVTKVAANQVPQRLLSTHLFVVVSFMKTRD